jgi:serine protease DegS
MAISTLQRNALFLAGSVLTGLAIAFLVSQLWPELLRNPGQPASIAAPAPFPEPGLMPAVTRSVSEAPPIPAPPPSAAPADAADLFSQAPNGSYAAAVRASSPAVVSVYTQRTVQLPGFDLERTPGGIVARSRESTQPGLGSGVIIDAEGHIVTNHHVIDGTSQINVRLADGRSAAARVVGRDPDTDLAVLKIDLPRLPVMKLGRSDRVQVGDIVLAIGNPLELLQTVTHGIVSATGRSGLGVALLEDFIQTDAAINRGNSGGALVNTRGELIGINTAVLGKNQGAEGIGVAIPVDLVRGVMREILQHGRVVRGWIGIDPRDIPANTSPAVLAQYGLPQTGVAIRGVFRNSPAQRAGLAYLDMIDTIDGQPVRSARDALARIATRRPGETVKITGKRRQQVFTLEIPVIEAPVQPPQ